MKNAKSVSEIVLPKVGDSVFIPFVTNGDGERLSGCSLQPFDKIDAVYAETDYNRLGQPIYSVRVKSGDALRIIRNAEKWKAVA